MALRLAEHVAHSVHVDAMLDSMTHEQFAEWCAKDMIEPIGHSGAHDVLARIGVLIAQFMGHKDADETMFKLWQRTQKHTDKTNAEVMALEAVGWRRA